MSDEQPAARPTLTVVSGDATAEEVAALVAVLAAASGGGDAADAGGRGSSSWADRDVAVRRPLPHGPGAWRASGLPR